MNERTTGVWEESRFSESLSSLNIITDYQSQFLGRFVGNQGQIPGLLVPKGLLFLHLSQLHFKEGIKDRLFRKIPETPLQEETLLALASQYQGMLIDICLLFKNCNCTKSSSRSVN